MFNNYFTAYSQSSWLSPSMLVAKAIRDEQQFNSRVFAVMLCIILLSATCLIQYVFFNSHRALEVEAQALIDAFDAHDEDLEELLTPDIFEPAPIETAKVASLPDVPEMGDDAQNLSVVSIPSRISQLLGSPHQCVLPNPLPSLTKRRRVHPNRVPIAFALAYDAAFKFGSGRTKSDANLLITRKWMRDRMEEYRDLRKKDLGAVVDAALDLSFYASESKRNMSLHCETLAHKERSNPLPAAWSWWPFTKVAIPRRA